MKVKLFYQDDKKETVLEALEDMEIDTSDEDSYILVEVSSEQYDSLSEISGITSIEKVGIFDLWRK